RGGAASAARACRAHRAITGAGLRGGCDLRNTADRARDPDPRRRRRADRDDGLGTRLPRDRARRTVVAARTAALSAWRRDAGLSLCVDAPLRILRRLRLCDLGLRLVLQR